MSNTVYQQPGLRELSMEKQAIEQHKINSWFVVDDLVLAVGANNMQVPLKAGVI